MVLISDQLRNGNKDTVLDEKTLIKRGIDERVVEKK